ncbi:MAG: hypothetical protein OEY17_04980 [Nitrosopumilus sp.]|nr:hypothetical protein [Nitrosopumilus sp.]MDH5658674.1 hypothetical protein [Nitrosopumilus sp.]
MRNESSRRPFVPILTSCLRDAETYDAMEDNVKINIRTFTEEKTHYYMKKGAKITIKDHVLKFDKAKLA